MYPLRDILFLDIETASQYHTFEDMPDVCKDLWAAKAQGLMRHYTEETTESLYSRAGIYAEFGKIICISFGRIKEVGGERKLSLTSIHFDDEKELLEHFCHLLSLWNKDGNRTVCAHNGKEFDFPYLCRRMTIHGMKLPGCLQIANKKPWELQLLDTMEMWKFGDFKSYTSLNLLAHVLGIPSPKDDIDGSMVGEVYWGAKTQEEREASLDRIATYCQKDVITVAQVYLRLQCEELISPANIEIKQYGPHQLLVRS